MSKVAIVTGGSRGIGAAIAKKLSAEGYKVCINYNNSKANADTLVKEIELTGGHAIALKANIGAENEIVKLFEDVDNLLGPVNVLVNNAGINGNISPVENVTEQCLQTVFSTNVFGTFICCREAVKRMKKNNKGSIVNISSEAAKFGGTQLAHYAASKAAVNTFTIAFAREVASQNIRVNAVSPGVINTEIHATSSTERLNNLMNSIPMKRMGETHEVAELVSWLISDSASYVSGAIIPITGSR